MSLIRVGVPSALARVVRTSGGTPAQSNASVRFDMPLSSASDGSIDGWPFPERGYRLTRIQSSTRPIGHRELTKGLVLVIVEGQGYVASAPQEPQRTNHHRPPPRWCQARRRGALRSNAPTAKPKSHLNTHHEPCEENQHKGSPQQVQAGVRILYWGLRVHAPLVPPANLVKARMGLEPKWHVSPAHPTHPPKLL